MDQVDIKDEPRNWKDNYQYLDGNKEFNDNEKFCN